MPRAAAFLDRDGTLMVDTAYPNDPAAVRLLPGAAEAVRRLNAAGVPVVVVTNQSGIARGLVTEAQYAAVRDRLAELLAAEGARLDATYHCPHHPDFGGACGCRKPGTLLYEQAAAALDLDPAASLFVGDRFRDVAAALHFGGRGVLLPSPADAPDDARRAAEAGVPLAAGLAEAVDAWLAERERGPARGP